MTNQKHIPWPNDVAEIIDRLNHIEVDGETMEFILKETCMKEQMLRQLVLSCPEEQLMDLISERKELPDFKSYLHVNNKAYGSI